MKFDKNLNVLIFPGGTEIGLEIYRSLRFVKNINVYSASNNVKNHGPFTFKNHRIIPNIDSKHCILSLNKIIDKDQINLIFPANDLIIDFLNNNREQLKSDIVLMDQNIVKLTRSKRDTYNYFKNILPIPLIYETGNVVKAFPVFAKPNAGYGSQGTKIINSQSELSHYIKCNQDSIIQEYLPGDEYTIDCFSSKKDGLIFHAGRKRNRIRMGTSMNGTLVDEKLNAIFENYAKIINEILNMVGAWFFQMKKDASGNLKLLEIQTRIAGTMAINRSRGVNFALLSIYEKLGMKYTINFNSYDVEIDRSLKNKYITNIHYETVYIDLDDTIISNGRLNINIIQFLYQCINNKKKIILLTKSLSKNIEIELEKYKIKEIFDKIIWIKEFQKKEDFIDKSKKPIFIDDSFSQRQSVFSKLKIHTFDPSFIEVLIDNRT